MLARVARWTAMAVLAVMLTIVPFLYYRVNYDHSKRLRVVTKDVLYRAGQMTEEGIEDAVRRHGIRTIVNFQNEAPDPVLESGLRESEVCRRLGVRYVHIGPDLVHPVYLEPYPDTKADKARRARSALGARAVALGSVMSPAGIPEALPVLAIAADLHWPRRPTSIQPFLAIMDDPANHPVLIHCRAGLHRTGIFAAIYRMEYQGWSRDAAIRELRTNGFGDSQCNARNLYILEYLLIYEPRDRSGQITRNKIQEPSKLQEAKDQDSQRWTRSD